MNEGSQKSIELKGWPVPESPVIIVTSEAPHTLRDQAGSKLRVNTFQGLGMAFWDTRALGSRAK